MSPIIHHIDSDETLPKSADVVVIGGGIIGASAAYFLARRGLSVALIETGVCRLRTVEPELGLVPPAEPRCT
jgi:thioredoxin reductase